MGSLLMAILILVIVVSIFYRNNDPDETDRKEQVVIAKLKEQYRQALKSGNRAAALEAGRTYYRYLRNSRELSSQDEQAIAKDLAAME
ncbi:hypothetical protein [Flavisolibacter nicotianae]|uniref:hypothetical protein n=1 Tax=Flavisolibacter nicotianae TaxID=2364882 RepID=UPI000EB51C61|nr:hypothetical protein [Flavisolibacter nicotianae]